MLMPNGTPRPTVTHCIVCCDTVEYGEIMKNPHGVHVCKDCMFIQSTYYGVDFMVITLEEATRKYVHES